MDFRRLWMPILLLVLAAAVGYGMYRLFTQSAPVVAPPLAAPGAPPAAAAAAAPAAPAKPSIARFPLPDGEPPEVALQAPAVPSEEALAAFSADLAGFADGASLTRFFGLEGVVRRAVSSADNITADELPIRARVVRNTPGAFAVRRQGDSFWLDDEANHRRYEPFVRFVESLDTRRAASLYTRHYALFQGEFRNQGSPDRYFNDRVVAAIDHLLATPEVSRPVQLVQPRVLFRYADPAIESLSAGQKAMIRVGPENAARLKAKLRAMRAELVRTGGSAAN